MRGRTESRRAAGRARRMAVLVAMALATTLLPSLATPAWAAGVRIMPAGDSITEGANGDATYRYFLWHQLRGAGRSVDFVGTRVGVKDGAPRYSDFDQQHQGFSGYRADQLANLIKDRAIKQRPDVVLLHIGTNDLNQGQSNASTKSDIALIVSRLREVNPNITVLLAQIINRSGREAATAGLNTVIAGLAGEVDTETSRVVLVDQYTGFDPSVDTRDGVHPSLSGEQKMAANWFEALDPLLGGAAPPPSPPSITSQPADQTVVAGQTATFSVSSSGAQSHQWKRGQTTIAGATGASYTTPATTTADDGATFSVVLTNSAGSTTSSPATLSVAPVPEPTGNRVTDGIVGLYTFSEGTGATVVDRSGAGSRLDLTIADPSRTEWLPGGGLAVRSATQLVSGPATRIVDAVKASGEVTLEAWVRPASLDQVGPAAIAGITKNYNYRNISLGQGRYADTPTAVDVRVRTTSTTAKGTSVTAPPNTLDGTLQHLVYTRSPGGEASLYVDGALVVSGAIGGTLAAWDSSYRIIVANEFGITPRPWLGELHLAAFYDRALTSGEVSQNHRAGAP